MGNDKSANASDLPLWCRDFFVNVVGGIAKMLDNWEEDQYDHIACWIALILKGTCMCMVTLLNVDGPLRMRYRDALLDARGISA